MDKGLSLIEVLVSAALISIVIIAVSALNLINIKNNNTTFERDQAFNIARAFCEKYKYENTTFSQGKFVIYIDGLEDIPDSIANSLTGEQSINYLDYNNLRFNNLLSKKYALYTETAVSQNLNILRVTVISMKQLQNITSLLITKPGGN